jgi:hypothetical protein
MFHEWAAMGEVQRQDGRRPLLALRPNVRAKLAPTVGRAGQVGENVQSTADLARVARRWGST